MIPKTTAVLVTGLFAGLCFAQIELNQATEIELDGLKGIGPATTRQVLAERQKTPFKDWSDVLARIRGLGAHKAAQLSDQGLRVQGEPFAPVSTIPESGKQPRK
ncbi:ComEA family DNA-binding protein [Limnohabitans lacus]|jgi:competence protein ComEA|uniref:Helix-hairpin-helix domain-containing protein n=1 Tax=Limnohabitans lacus TaxID=3045173 RepID=A0ABT6XB33_9BURK|nr:helix-hairpin-helix domain-containing protein [Limnohabitans sp. HM2-2]MDI9235112.1 helix-hairpin-helix domain-containing protein [Limnohabitans sp. HM2-2]